VTRADVRRWIVEKAATHVLVPENGQAIAVD